MKAPLLFAAALLAGGAAIAADTQVGVSIGITQPGVYGRIDIGNFPQPPRLVVPQPVVIAPAPVRAEPLYLYVPPGHRKNWRKHCEKYDACGRPVYFVREDWVQERYDEQHGHGKGKGKGKGHGKD